MPSMSTFSTLQIAFAFSYFLTADFTNPSSFYFWSKLYFIIIKIDAVKERTSFSSSLFTFLHFFESLLFITPFIIFQSFQLFVLIGQLQRLSKLTVVFFKERKLVSQISNGLKISILI